ncbi:MAG: hypothetical protein IKO38_01605, partial [Erysipelotrichaceae bacterium]|nr:hypothetical protein [Erysipelotrichaceae bacterium]
PPLKYLLFNINVHQRWSYIMVFLQCLSQNCLENKKRAAIIAASIIVLSLNTVAFLPDSKAKVSIK